MILVCAYETALELEYGITTAREEMARTCVKRSGWLSRNKLITGTWVIENEFVGCLAADCLLSIALNHLEAARPLVHYGVAGVERWYSIANGMDQSVGMVCAASSPPTAI
jgi:hypothetical protein